MRLTFEQKILSVSILVVTMLLIIIACTDPPVSPFVPGNANMELWLKSSDDAVRYDAFDSVNHAVKIGVVRVMPKFIDSISVKIINSSNLSVMDTMMRISSDATITDTVWLSQSFSLGDHYVVEALAYIEDKRTVYKSGQIRIDGVGNIKPKISVVGSHNPVPNIPCTLSVYGTDSNAGQVLSYTVADAPVAAVFSNQRLIWTPSLADTLSYTIKFKVSDNGLPPLSDSAVHVITVVKNLARPSKPEDLVVVERKVSTVKLKWNSAKNADSYHVYNVVKGGAAFTLRKSIYDTSYTDSVGAETYRYFVSAHNNAGSISSDTITVSAINVSSPVWYTDTFSVTISEGIPYKLNLPSLCKVTNDNDLKFTIINTDLIADTITVQKDYLFTPSYADAGNYSIILKAQQKLLLDTFVINMRVKNVNRAPELVQDYVHNSVFVLVGDTLKVPFSTIDADGDIVSYSVKNVTLPRSATLELSSLDGIVRWVSAAGDSGSYSFDLVARDSIDSTVVTVKVNVAKGNVGPFWNSKQLSITVNETQVCSLDLSLKASDINGDTLIYSMITALPLYDTIIGKMYRFTPGYNDSGTYNGIKLVVSDKVFSDTALLDLKVLNVNRAPAIANANDTTVPPNSLVSFTLSVYDPDGDAVRVLATTLPTGATFDTSTKVFTFKPAEGTHTAIFQASDGIETFSKTYIIKASSSAIPVFEIQPVAIIRCEGSSALFFVKAKAEGATTLAYQWRKNGIAINGQIKDSLVILYPALSDSGMYDCIVTNSGASKTSNAVKLTVNSNSVKPSSVTASPSTVCVGSIVRLTVFGGNLGTGVAMWEWFKDYACTTPLTYSSLTLTASSVSITESAAGTKKAYVRAKGTCNETLDSVTYTVAAIPIKPSLVSASDSSVTTGDTVTLSAKTSFIIDGKGSLGDLAIVKWYAGGCGGRAIGSGATLKVVPPSGTTVYYARTENGSCASACDSVSVKASIIRILPIDTLIARTPIMEK
jgi:Immunoglobulin domain/Ig-like domain CHU_C associated/Bacterial Ig domain